MEPQLDPTPPPTTAAPIKAGVSVTAIQPEKSFQSIIDQNADVWPTLKPEQVQKAADAYLDKYVHPLPGFQQLSDDQKNNFYTEFNKKYNVGQVGLDYNVADDPLSKALIPVQRFGDLATLGIPARSWDAMHMGEGNTAETRDAQLNQYATDPGLYGDMYRLSQAPAVKGIGGLIGMFKGAGGPIQQAEQSGLGALTSAYGAGNKLLKPFIGTAEKAAGAIGATGWNAVNHGMAALRGDETPGQALASLGVDTALLGIGGKGRVGNALAQGAGGAGSSLLGNVIHGQPLNWQDALQGGLTQAGVGAAFPHHESAASKPKGPMIKGREYAQSVGKFSRGNRPTLSHESYQANQLKKAVKGKLAETATLESVDKSKTLSSRIGHLQRQYETLSRTANHPGAPAKVKATAQKAREKILEIHDRLKAEYEALHSKPKKKGKEPLEHVTDPEDLKALIGLVKEMRQKGNLRQADVAMGRFTRETKAKVFDEVKRQEKLEGIKVSQAQKDNKALNDSDESNNKRTNKQLQSDVQARAKEQNAEQEQSSASKPKESIQRKDFQSVHKMRETAREANKSGESVRIRYYAERTGETGEIEYKTLHDVKIIEGKGGKETKWKGINEDGQMHHYIERNGTNSMQDSNIISVERTHEPVKYKLEVHPETGMAHPVDVETGEFIPQTYKPGVKSSEIHSKIDLLRKLDAGERVSPQDVMNVARQHEVKQMKEVSEKMTQAERSKSYEETAGRPCPPGGKING